jgi:cell division septal protein FtsQ
VLVGRVAPRGSETLRRRRRRSRLRLALIALVLLLAIAAGADWLLWQPFLRVQYIGMSGYASATAPAAARAAMDGAYLKIIPRDSIVFLPEAAIRGAVLAADANVAAAGVSRAGLDSITLKLIPRASAYMWCGTDHAAPGPCYEADASGVIFAQATGTPALSSALVSSASSADAQAQENPASSQNFIPANGELAVFAPLATTAPSILGSAVSEAALIPPALRFARALDSLDAVAVSIQIRGDEADVYLASGTRVTYVLGQEQQAADAAAAAFPTLNLDDGSIQYVDLRFGGKAYVKKADDASAR